MIITLNISKLESKVLKEADKEIFDLMIKKKANQNIDLSFMI